MTAASPPGLPSAERWAELGPVLEELLDLPEEQRPPRLAELRARDPALADELTALLSDGAKAASEGFLAGAVPLAPAESAASSLAGQHLGPYVLEEPLGQGGGGSVWRARREDGRFEGAVAIKLLHLSLLGRAGAERFRREGHILARLKHPHIASLLDAGVTPGGQPYLVLELVQGERIDRHCDALGLSIEARLELFSDVLAAVAHAHTHGVIHRDLKPGNILVTHEGQVKLLDFGVAKLLDDEAGSGESTELTREGGRALTPEYAAPEQLRGEGVTTATDVYALGVLLYQLLCGQHPTAPSSGNAAEALRATLDTEPLPPSRRLTITEDEAASRRASNPQRLQRMLTGDLDTIVSHALRKAPGERYATVAALAEDLRRYRDHEPVIARPDSVAYRARKFVRRHRGAVAAGVLTSLAIVAGVAGTVWQAQRAQQAAQLAEQHAQRAEREKKNALADLENGEAMLNLMQALLGAVADKPVLPAELLQRAGSITDKEYAAAPGTRAFIQERLSHLWAMLGDQEKALALAERAAASAESSSDADPRMNTRCLLASQLTIRGDFAKARQLFDTAIAMAAKTWPDEPDRPMACLQQRAVLNLEEGQPKAALADADEAQRLLGTPRAGQADMALMLREIRADALSAMGQLGPAVREYEAVLAELRRLGRIELRSSMVTLNQMGVALMRGGQFARGVQVMDQALQIAQASGQPDAVDVPTLTNHARALLEVGRTAEARQQFDRAVAHAQRSAQPRLIGHSALQAASAACDTGDLARCTTLFELGAKHLEAILPPRHRSRSALLTLRGRLAFLKGQPHVALRDAQAAMALLGESPGSQQQLSLTLPLLARAQSALGEHEAALASAQAAVKSAREAYQDFPTSTPLGKALLRLGKTFHARGQQDEARAAWQSAAEQLRAASGPQAPALLEAEQLLATLP